MPKPGVGRESRFLRTPPVFDAPLGVPVGILPRLVLKKTIMVWLLDGEEILKIQLFVSTE